MMDPDGDAHAPSSNGTLKFRAPVAITTTNTQSSANMISVTLCNFFLCPPAHMCDASIKDAFVVEPKIAHQNEIELFKTQKQRDHPIYRYLLLLLEYILRPTRSYSVNIFQRHAARVQCVDKIKGSTKWQRLGVLDLRRMRIEMAYTWLLREGTHAELWTVSDLMLF